MDIKEIQLLTGLSQDEINFYDSQGLISTEQNLDLNKENIEQLKYIKLLLKLDTPISQIKEFNSKKISLEYVLEEKIKELENDKINIDFSIHHNQRYFYYHSKYISLYYYTKYYSCSQLWNTFCTSSSSSSKSINFSIDLT